jgi:AraC-like DNA-binding protein
MQRRIEPPLTIGEVAQLLGWSRRQTARVLHRLNRELCGLLLKREPGFGRGVRWTVTRAALRRVRPEWFEDTSLISERLEDLSHRVESLAKRQDMTATAVGQLFRKVERERSRTVNNGHV